MEVFIVTEKLKNELYILVIEIGHRKDVNIRSTTKKQRWTLLLNYVKLNLIMR